MTIKLTGDIPKVQRIPLGLFSFDHAFMNRRGQIGIPLMSTVEVYGPTNAGKSTFCYSLAGMIAKELQSNTALCDFERLDPETLTDILQSSGFDGELKYISSGDDDEETLGELVETLREGEHKVGILDSVGAVSPISEIEGEIGEAHMGRRAKLMAQFIRKNTHMMKTNPDRIVFAVNHIHPNLGSVGTSTPGGETLKYLYAVRIKVVRKEEFPDRSFLMEGTVVKNTFGYRGKIFRLFIQAGLGIHKGLTALWDCIGYGLAEKTKQGIIKVGETSYGRFSGIVKTADTFDFTPFYELLKTLPDDAEFKNKKEDEDE